MEFKRSVDGSVISAILGILLGFVAFTEGYVHFVGGRDGWDLSPSESYNHWAAHTRFQVNDTLVFSYPKSDSVLEVNETDYNTCNTNNPIQALQGSYSIFKLDRSGPFYFISGVADRCYKGQKMVIVVMAVRSNIPNVSPSISPFPSISMPPTGSNFPPSALPGGALSPAPGAGTGIAPEPVSGGPTAGIAPVSGPTGPGIGIGPSSEPASRPIGPDMGGMPSSAPGEPAANNDCLTPFIGIYWVLLVFGSMIFQGVI